MATSIHIADPERTDWQSVLQLLQSSFAYMEAHQGRPPAVNKLNPEDLKIATQKGPVLLAQNDGDVVACLFCRPSQDFPEAYYIGWLAVSPVHRGIGLAQSLIEKAATIASEKGFSALTLDTGASLRQVQQTFQKCGFNIISNAKIDSNDVVTMMRQL